LSRAGCGLPSQVTENEMCLDSSLGHLVAYASEFFLAEASERNRLSTAGKARLVCQSKAR